MCVWVKSEEAIKILGLRSLLFCSIEVRIHRLLEQALAVALQPITPFSCPLTRVAV